MVPVQAKAIQQLESLFDSDHDALAKLKADNDNLRATKRQRSGADQSPDPTRRRARIRAPLGRVDSKDSLLRANQIQDCVWEAVLGVTDRLVLSDAHQHAAAALGRSRGGLSPGVEAHHLSPLSCPHTRASSSPGGRGRALHEPRRPAYTGCPRARARQWGNASDFFSSIFYPLPFFQNHAM